MNNLLFETIAEKLSTQGFCVLPNALPKELAIELEQLSKNVQQLNYAEAGVGRGNRHQTDKQIRSDKIHWIESNSDAENAWLEFMGSIQSYLNSRLFLGLFSYESHFAHYTPGAFYEKHLDAFKGQSNRILSTVTYLNSNWDDSAGGELLIYDEAGNEVLEKVTPNQGTLVIFLSEEFPHEVLPATTDRFSIAGWFRVNNSNSARVDPPR